MPALFSSVYIPFFSIASQAISAAIDAINLGRIHSSILADLSPFVNCAYVQACQIATKTKEFKAKNFLESEELKRQRDGLSIRCERD
jgi:hypothetical protein